MLWFSCLCVPSSEKTGMHHHTQLSVLVLIELWLLDLHSVYQFSLWQFVTLVPFVKTHSFYNIMETLWEPLNSLLLQNLSLLIESISNFCLIQLQPRCLPNCDFLIWVLNLFTYLHMYQNGSMVTSYILIYCGFYHIHWDTS